MKALAAGTVLLVAGLAACSPNPAKRLAQACIKDGNMTQAQCQCIADRAGKDLSRDAQELLVAQAEENAARVEELSKKMTLADAQNVGAFMMNVSTQCITDTGDE